MIKLKSLKLNKYKSIQKPQLLEISPEITTIVGMNEAGKTSVLTALGKTNYFNPADEDFKFDVVQDFPRSELIDFQSSDEDCEILECRYEISDELLDLIAKDIGPDVFIARTFSRTHSYKSEKVTVVGIKADEKKFISQKVEHYVLSEETKKAIIETKSLKEIESIIGTEEDVGLADFKKLITTILNGAFDLDTPLAGYVAKTLIHPHLPKFWYFDDYYPLSGKININRLKHEAKSESEKTSKALFELARINPDDIIGATDKDYEKFIAMLEASSNKITNEIFKYWSTNKNLDIEFKIQEITNASGQKEKYLDIRVKSQRHKITLPLDRRSKGFNWFFSFIIWFSKIQADKGSNYILLLDEPGLNLHASAQSDLLKFFEDLSKKYQIIYTTHSPFMVESTNLSRVRTCFETDEGTVISDSIQEKDPNTLFPLQAALGYDIAQNLFVSKNNLLVEGPADLLFLTMMSGILESLKRVGLKDSITIVPVGGLDKVTTFISLLRGSKLNVTCLLDTFTDAKGKQKVDDLIQQKIIKAKSIRFFHEFITGYTTADIEDLFEKKEYIRFFNEAFSGDHAEVKEVDLDANLPTIIKQVNKAIGKDRYNHYRPAYKATLLGLEGKDFSGQTLDRFEAMFKEINSLF